MISDYRTKIIEDLIIEKSANVTNAIVDDIVEYNVVIINQGNRLIEDMIIIDTLVDKLKFIQESVTINDISKPRANILEGIKIGNLKPGEMKFISYKVRVVLKPEDGYIKSLVIAEFCCDPMLNGNLELMNKRSNIVSVKIDEIDILFHIISDKKKVLLDDCVKYTATIKNASSLEIKNIIITLNLPKEVELIKDKIDIDGETLNYEGNTISVYLGDLYQGKSKNINYEVIVKQSNSRNILQTNALVKFKYELDNESVREKILSFPKSCEEEINISNFKQISLDRNLFIPAFRPEINEIINLKVNAKIKEHHVIETISALSNENQNMLGHKLIIQGVLEEVVSYNSKDNYEGTFSEIYKIPFSTFIILPEYYKKGYKIQLNSQIVDIYYKKMSNRKFFENIILLINAKILTY